MTKSDLVDSVASKTGLTKKDTSRTIDAMQHLLDRKGLPEPTGYACQA
jgi:nucleoid DNA-binding protein